MAVLDRVTEQCPFGKHLGREVIEKPGATVRGRIDYLRPAPGDSHREAVLDSDDDTAVAKTEIFDADDNSLA